MATYRGFVQSIQLRDDGWVETAIRAVHAGNTVQTFFIPNLDGDLMQTHKRLGQLSLLRDALARVEPVELDYSAKESQGNLVEDVTILPRESIEGRRGSRLLAGVVIGVSITERGPESGSPPYRDEPNLAAISLLRDDGTVEGLLLDLQRPDPGTGAAQLAMLQQAHRTRRPVELLVTGGAESGSHTDVKFMSAAGAPAGAGSAASGGFIETCRWVTLPRSDLDYVYAFIERLGQRYESYDNTEAGAASHLKVVYTLAPGQTPEGDISDNGSFVPQRLVAQVHADSPLVGRLVAALRDCLQVKLGLKGRDIHEVELVADLGSAARPIWIVTSIEAAEAAHHGECVNQPTIQVVDGADLDRVPRSVEWHGQAYFRRGVWRFVVRAPGAFRLLVDGHAICKADEECAGAKSTTPALEHAYLDGLHRIDLRLDGYSCRATFELDVYRIR